MTRPILAMRVVGEHARMTDTLGISVSSTRLSAVADLISPDFLIEIEAIAVVRGARP